MSFDLKYHRGCGGRIRRVECTHGANCEYCFECLNCGDDHISEEWVVFPYGHSEEWQADVDARVKGLDPVKAVIYDRKKGLILKEGE
jgi:hypothetical protein